MTSPAVLREEPTNDAVPHYRVPGWTERFGVIAGITGRGAEAPGFDLGLHSDEPVGPIMARWEAFQTSLPTFHGFALGDQVQPKIVAVGSSALVVWSDSRNDAGDIYGARLDETGIVTAEVQIAAGAGWQGAPAIVAIGSGAIVVWEEGDSTGSRSGIYGALLDDQGQIGISGLSIARKIGSAPSVTTSILSSGKPRKRSRSCAEDCEIVIARVVWSRAKAVFACQSR